MKKVFKGLLCFGLLLGLVACSSSNNAKEQEKGVEDVKEPTFQDVIEFDGLEITFTGDYEFLTFDNEFSELDGSEVVKVAVNIHNVSEEKNGINMFYLTVYGSKGTEIEDMSVYYSEDDMLFNAGTDSLRSGASMDTFFHFIYDGDGDYYVSFSDFFNEVEVKLPISK